MVRRVILIGVCALASTAYAAQPANDIDLKAAYCFGRVKDLHPIDAALYSGEQARIVNTVNNRVASAQSRLRAYLLPRLNFVDPSAIMAAAKAGEDDQKAYIPAINDCWKRAQSESNTAASIAESKKCSANTTSSKLTECEEATFLPF